MTYIDTLGQQAKVAGRQIAKLSTAAKNDLLNQVAKALVAESAYIITENAKDMANAKENGISEIMQDRLLLTEDRIAGIAEGVRQMADLQDPIGQVVRGYTNLDGLKIIQKRVPMGVIAMIFESRPNVSIDAFSLAFKTNNAIILRGGRDAINSNKALVTVARKALENAGITADAVQLVEDTSHEVAEELMAATKYVDLLIPRGGARLIQTVKEKAKVPVIETGVGNCHIYVDKYANLDMATQIVINAKTQRPSVCNAAESLVVHADIAEYVKDATSEKLRKLEEIISKKEITAVGEIGMDLYYESDIREAQKELFIYQIELAKKYNKPILVHSRDAMQDTYDIMKEHHVRGLLHCFSGSAEMAVEFTKLGYYIALGGAATFKNARHALEVCKAIDMKYLLSETDCPYMAPVPVRGTRNEPCNIPYIVDVLAKTRDISVEEMANTIDENYKRFLKEINESN